MVRTLMVNWYMIVSVFAVLLLASCERRDLRSDDIQSSRSAELPAVPAATTISGRVLVAGYLQGARVFLDRNANRRYDNGEPLAISGEDGAFILHTNPGENKKYSIIAEINDPPASGSGEPNSMRYLLEAPPGYGFVISPLTTLVTLKMDKNPTIGSSRAQWQVKQQLGIADEVSLFDDYLMLAKTHHELSQEYARTKKTAVVVASLLGKLRTGLEQNLGRRIDERLEQYAAFLISDQIFQHAAVIRQALDAERNVATVISAAQLFAAIEDILEVDSLNQSTLDFYARRLDQKQEFWDMDPLRLERKSPIDGAIVTIDAVISLFFDQPLDRDRLAGNSIVVNDSQRGEVAGSLSYHSEQRRLRFIPDQRLQPNSDYRVVVSGDITDTRGNRLGKDLIWVFSTTFDKTPPLPILQLQ